MITYFLISLEIMLLCTIIAWLIVFIWQAFQTDAPMKYIVEQLLAGLYLRKQDYREIDRYLTIPNITTIIGILSTIGYLIAALTQLPGQTQFIVITIVSDILDGFFARTLDQCSRVGKIIDPARDRIFMATVLTIMLQGGSAVLIWIIIAIIFVEVCVVCSNATQQDARVHAAGKIRMAVHMLCGMVFVLQNAGMMTVIIENVSLAEIILAASLFALLGYVRQNNQKKQFLIEEDRV